MLFNKKNFVQKNNNKIDISNLIFSDSDHDEDNTNNEIFHHWSVNVLIVNFFLLTKFLNHSTSFIASNVVSFVNFNLIYSLIVKSFSVFWDENQNVNVLFFYIVKFLFHDDMSLDCLRKNESFFIKLRYFFIVEVCEFRQSFDE